MQLKFHYIYFWSIDGTGCYCRFFVIFILIRFFLVCAFFPIFTPPKLQTIKNKRTHNKRNEKPLTEFLLPFNPTDLKVSTRSLVFLFRSFFHVVRSKRFFGSILRFLFDSPCQISNVTSLTEPV